MNILHRTARPRPSLARCARQFRTALAAVLLSWSAAAMAQTPAAPQPATPTPVAPAPAAAPPVLNSALDAPLFYQLLLAEMHVLANDPGTGYSLLLDAARAGRNAQIYRRAVDVALQARSGEAALTAARAWAQDLPDDAQAKRFVLQILLALNRVGETAPVLRALLERSSPAERNDTINQIPQAFAGVADKDEALALVRAALAPWIRQRAYAASSWATLGRMELLLGQLPQALASARQGLDADPASPFPALLALELFERGQTGAEPLLRRHLQVNPESAPGGFDVSQAYARALLERQRYAEARSQLDALIRRQPELPEPWLLLGSLQLQERALGAATTSLQTYIDLALQETDERSARGLTQAYLLMAQIAEAQNDIAAAGAWLERIENAAEIIAVQMRRASLLARQGQLEQARALLRSQPERQPSDARLKLVAEAQLLRDFNAYQQSFEVYAEAVRRFPQDTELLYNQAMMAERAGKPEEMERLLRQLMAAEPGHYHALNALGYSLADRNIRLPEAKALIERALALAPDNAYILDSLGWVEFRLGNLERALQFLQKAYGKHPYAEIAAHLGEVLWALSQREQAQRIWREGLLQSSDNETLQETLKRHQVQP